jgi:tight adherence protein C
MAIEQIVAWATLAGVTAVVWAIASKTLSRPRSVDDRLKELCNDSDEALFRLKQMSQRSHLELVVDAAVPKVSKVLEPQSGAERANLKQKLSHAGFNGPAAVPTFLAIKTIAMASLALIGTGSGLAAWGLSQYSTMACFGGAAVGLLLPDFVLGWLARARQERIFFTLPSVLDLLVIGIEVGRGMDVAFREVVLEMRHTAADLCDEIDIYLRHLQLGHPRAEALRELGSRGGVDDLNSLAAVLIQSERFGTSVAAALRDLSESIRVRRRQMAEEQAQKTAVKMLFPLVLFIFPGVFVVLVGPAAISVVNEMLAL